MARRPSSSEAVDRVRIGPAEEAAAGPAAVTSSLRHAIARMGPLRSARTLRRVNQADGFDCPGCAWPEPADRHLAEFCENGVKAVAEEATPRRAGPHTFGTRVAAAGVPLRTLQEWMGHRDFKTTLIYADYQPSEREAELLERAFGRPPADVAPRAN